MTAETVLLLLAALTGTASACALLGKPRASHYRDRAPVPLVPAQRAPRSSPPSALTPAEQQQVLDALTSPRFCDKSVAQTWATLLDEGIYLASQSTMHRLLRQADQAGERRNQATHPAKTKPELMATGPGQVWSWDITKLCGPKRGVYYDLYVILDIYSRYVVGWTVAAREDAQRVQRGRVQDPEILPGVPGQLRVPARRTSVLRELLRLLQPRAPHSGIGLHTPASVHYGTATQVRQQRQATPHAAYAANPLRFSNHRPEPPTMPAAAWINQPSREALIHSA